MRILIEDEYGYRQWVWTPQQENAEKLISYWQNLDENFFDSIVLLCPTYLTGIWQELKMPMGANSAEEDWYYTQILNKDNYDGFGHIHEFCDSYLTLKGKKYALSQVSNFARLPKE